MNDNLIDSGTRNKDWRSIWFATLTMTMLLNGAIASLLSVFKLSQGTTVENFVYSYCIGTVVSISILTIRQLAWPRSRPSPAAMAVAATAAVAVGLVVGLMLASLLLGKDIAAATIFDDDVFRVSLVVTVLASFAGTVYFWRREQAAYERQHREIVSRQLAQAQLQLLRAQVDPHMLFNTLANLRVLIGRDPSAAQTMLDRLIDFFRASLAASQNEWSSLEREFKLADDYLQLIAIRMGTRLRFELQLPATLRNARVPSMLLQPLIENAIKHGLEPSRSGGQVTVSASAQQSQLELTVRDTGIGLGRAASTSSGGFGSAQIRDRLRTLFHDQATFELLPLEPSGTLARIRLPLQTVAAPDAQTAKVSL